MRIRNLVGWSALPALAALALLAGGTVLAAQGTPAKEAGATRYVATLKPLNAHAAGHRAHGILEVSVKGDEVTFVLRAAGLPPDMTHMAHLHGFVDGKAATCPTAAADTNHDGVIDLNETEPMAGITLVPFNGDPAALDVPGPGYPKATASGHITYRTTVSLAKLNAAMASHYQGAKLDLAQRVIFLHGVPSGTHLPSTAGSLPGVPAQATLPIACGVLHPLG